jgi:predicted  nucleic acid-binding Zn-ribbon protein
MVEPTVLPVVRIERETENARLRAEVSRLTAERARDKQRLFDYEIAVNSAEGRIIDAEFAAHGAQERVAELERQVERHRGPTELQRLRDENAGLRMALRFYADASAEDFAKDNGFNAHAALADERR